MTALLNRPISILLTAAVVCACGLLNATPSKLESNSPFLPPGYSKVKPTIQKPVQQNSTPISQDLEFRGVVQLGGAYQFSLFKKSENRGYWIAENSSENGIGVSNFDPDNMQITVSANGRSEQLTLMTASENPLPVAALSNPMQTAQTPPRPPNIQPANIPKKANNQRRTLPRRRVIVPPKR